MYKCKWCKDTGQYFPLHGPAEPCRECAAFVRSNDKAILQSAKGISYKGQLHITPSWTVVNDTLERLKSTPIYNPMPLAGQTLFVTHLISGEVETLRNKIPYSATGRTAEFDDYVATWPEHVPRILEVLGWDAWDTRLSIDDGKWIMKHEAPRHAKIGETIIIKKPWRYTVTNPNSDALQGTPQ